MKKSSVARTMSHLCILFIVCLVYSSPHHAQEPRDTPDSDRHAAFGTYKGIYDLYRRWDRGLFGSRPYYRRELYRCLLESAGKEIVTDHSYVYHYPEALYDPEFRSTFICSAWLGVYGPVDQENLKAIMGDDASLLKKWWRTTRLVSIHGKIAGFRLIERPTRMVLIKLEKIQMR